MSIPIPLHKRFSHYFSTQAAPASAAKPTILQQPTFGENLVRQWEYLKEYQRRYNTLIAAKRYPLEQKKLSLQKLAKKGNKQAQNEIERLKQTLAGHEYQQLRDHHYQLIKELVIIARKAVAYNNAYLFAEGFNRVDTSQPYHIEVSYPALRNNLGGCDRSTIYRRLERLKVAGLLCGKIFHGTNAPFELLITPGILLLWDKQNPNFEPTAPLPGKTVQSAFPAGQSANCNHIISLNRLENSPIVTKWISSGKPSEELINENRTPLKRTPPKCETPIEPQKETEGAGPQNLPQKAPVLAQSLDEPGTKAAIKQEITGKKRTLSPQNFGGNLQNYAFAQTVLFLKAAISKLWATVDLNPGLICKVEDQIFANYLQNCSSAQAIDDTISRMLAVIQHNAKYIAADPANRFALLPHLYFDKKRKPKDADDFSGFMGQVRHMKKSGTWDKFKQTKRLQAEKHEFNRQKTAFLRLLRKHQKQEPGFCQPLRLLRKVEKQAPQMLGYFIEFQSTGQRPKIEFKA